MHCLAGDPRSCRDSTGLGPSRRELGRGPRGRGGREGLGGARGRGICRGLALEVLRRLRRIGFSEKYDCLGSSSASRRIAGISEPREELRSTGRCA